MQLARTTIASTRVARLLEALGDRPAADLDALALTLIKVAQIAVELPEIVSLEINPLLVDAEGVLALDAHIRIDLRRRGLDRLSIRPYPRELEQELTLSDGTRFLLRPIRPEDEPLIRDTVQRLDPEDARMRFFVPIREMTHQLGARLTQIDYDRQMALVAIGRDAAGGETVLGVVRLACDPDNVSGEFAVTVASRRKRQGLGRRLMKHIIAYGRARGLQRITGVILRENTSMLRLAQELGFRPLPSSPDPATIEVALQLD